MPETAQPAVLLVLLVGAVFILVALIRGLLDPVGIPPLVGYLLLGLVLRVADGQWGFLAVPAIEHTFEFLADIGIVILLFRVGLETNPGKLVRKLPRSSVIFAGNLLVAALFGYVTAYYGLGLAAIPSLIVATALSATSVGVSVAAWQEVGALNTGNGHLLVNVAELDDIAAVALFALLFAVIPVLSGGNSVPWGLVGTTAGSFLGKLALFTAGCILFARYLAPYMTLLGVRLEPHPRPMMTVVGVGFVIAAIGGWLGLSLAVGALFAGLVFSRDPGAWEHVSSFDLLYRYVAPFFFIEIGLLLNPEALLLGLELGGVLLAVAILGKLAGTILPALGVTSWPGAVLLGVSMVPRAEIAMLIMHQGRQTVPGAVSDELYAGMVVVTAGTCILAPLVLRPLLQRWPQTVSD